MTDAEKLPLLLAAEKDAVIACEQSGKEWDYMDVCILIGINQPYPGCTAREADDLLGAHYDRLNGVDI